MYLVKNIVALHKKSLMMNEFDKVKLHSLLTKGNHRLNELFTAPDELTAVL
jgi:hypothetical protein